MPVKGKELSLLLRITEQINKGVVLEEILDNIYDSFHTVIPYDRIGFALLEDEGRVLRSVWEKSEAINREIYKGYAAPMQKSSLAEIIETGKPRIINDLRLYGKDHPHSESTKKILKEGLRSSLTCPLIARGKPLGFIFFSSNKPHTYEAVHIDLFLQIAGQVAVITEKSLMHQRLLELNDLKNKFLGIAAHDLRDPLSVIKMNLSLFTDGFLGEVKPDQLESIEMMSKWCDRIFTIITDLLDVSAIESGQLTLKKELCDPRELLQENIRANGVIAKAKEIELFLDVPDGLKAVNVDSNRIMQVLNNLISNAIKYSHPRTKVILKAQQGPKALKISVIDQGQGIPAEELPKLFQFFGKTKVRPTKGEPSTGLGLAIVKRIIEAHGGVVSVESKKNKGSAFIFTLPF